MVVSQKKRDPNIDPKILQSSLWGPPKRVPLILGKSHIKGAVVGVKAGIHRVALSLGALCLMKADLVASKESFFDAATLLVLDRLLACLLGPNLASTSFTQTPFKNAPCGSWGAVSGSRLHGGLSWYALKTPTGVSAKAAQATCAPKGIPAPPWKAAKTKQATINCGQQIMPGLSNIIPLYSFAFNHPYETPRCLEPLTT